MKPLTSEDTTVEIFTGLVDALSFTPHISKSDLDLAFASATGWISACQRKFGITASSEYIRSFYNIQTF